jgi:excisionase family DNA binding protein
MNPRRQPHRPCLTRGELLEGRKEMARNSGTVAPLLSVDETAIILGTSRSSIYRSIERGDLPVPVFKINGRLRIARRAVERLLAGELPLSG